MPMPRFIAKQPASHSDVRAAEARVVDVLARLISDLDKRMTRLESQVGALHLGSTCHPEWVRPGTGLTASISRARVVESVLSFMVDDEGMTIKELAAYLHIPASRLDTLRDDLQFLAKEDRVQRMPRHRWRIKDSRNAT